MKQRYKYLILGHSRSGTNYSANLFRQNGIDIGHEKMGKDGTSSWLMAVRAHKYPWGVDGITRDQCEFDTIIHVMRKPIDVINSVAFTEKPESQAFKRKFIDIQGNQFERAVRSYYGWTKLIQKQKPDHTIKVENLMEFMKFEIAGEITNKRPHVSITEEELRKEVSDEVWDMYVWLNEFYDNL